MAKTKEEKAEVRRLYYLKNKDQIKEKAKKWAEENRERYLTRARKYANEHKEEAVVRATEWKKKNREYYNKYRNEWEKSIFFKRNAARIYEIMKKNSVKRKREFTLEKDRFVEWYNSAKKNCFYCTISEEYIYEHGVNRLQIDRVDNGKSYQLDNMVLACVLCNKIKSNLLTEEETKFIGINVILNKWKTKQSV